VLVLRSPEDAARITDATIRQLVETRFRQLSQGGTFDSERCGFMALIERGDVIDELERVTGVDVLADVFEETHFGDADFTPAAEAIEDHGSCYELVFIFTDDGYGIEIFVPKADGVNPELLAMCAQFAVPASDLASR
jgi:hypothetical protein